jgi:ATP-dependent 26S proteasome regulatory subunit
MARACAAECNATFLKLAGPQLVQVRMSPYESLVWNSLVKRLVYWALNR